MIASPTTPMSIIPKLPQFTLLEGGVGALAALVVNAGTTFVTPATAFVSSGALVEAVAAAVLVAATGVALVAAGASSSACTRSGFGAEARERLEKKEYPNHSVQMASTA